MPRPRQPRLPDDAAELAVRTVVRRYRQSSFLKPDDPGAMGCNGWMTDARRGSAALLEALKRAGMAG